MAGRGDRTGRRRASGQAKALSQLVAAAGGEPPQRGAGAAEQRQAAFKRVVEGCHGWRPNRWRAQAAAAWCTAPTGHSCACSQPRALGALPTPEPLHLGLQLALLVLKQRLVDGVGLGGEVLLEGRLPKHVVGKDVAAAGVGLGAVSRALLAARASAGRSLQRRRNAALVCGATAGPPGASACL